MKEIPVSFQCEGEWLYGVVHPGAPSAGRGVLVVVGGPQYRVGSHRQFMLLARALAARGIPAMRFDYRGMGDSEGEPGVPEPCEHLTPDIRTAVDAFFAACPDMREVTLWGLCDGASAAFMYAPLDPRVTGIVALNPWVDSQQTPEQAYLKHYYLRRLFSIGLWRKVLRGRFNAAASLRHFLETAAAALWRTGSQTRRQPAPEAAAGTAIAIADKMTDGLSRFGGRVLIILSGNDRVAAEFRGAARASRRLRRLLRGRRVVVREYPGVDHTFSRREWRDRVADWSADWVAS